METSGHSNVSMELVRVKQEPERLIDPERQQRVHLLTEHIKLEIDYKEEASSGDEVPIDVKVESDSDGASSYHDSEETLSGEESGLLATETGTCDDPTLDEECSVKPEVSRDAVSDEDLGSARLSSADKPAASAAFLVARAKEQLALACSVRLERLRSDEAPHANQTSHHGPRRASRVEDVPPHADKQTYSCDTCRIQFADKSMLITHQRLCTCVVKHSQTQTHTKFYCYDIGSGQVKSKSILIRHIKSPKDTNPLMLKTHSLCHNVERPYLCQQCNKSFKRRYSLHLHERTHSGEKPYTCKECNKRFARKDYFHEHRRNHSGVKPYVCKVCSKGFVGKSSLNKHERIHRNVTNVKNHLP